MNPDLLWERFETKKGWQPARRGDDDLNPGMPAFDKPLREAAVLVPVVDRGADGMTILLTKRTDHLQHHPGQISFPGGHIEDSDDGPEDAALRETEEEVGLPRKHIKVVGTLDEYITRTGFSVIPVVGIVEPPFPMKPDPEEVAEVFEVPLDFLMDPANHQRHSREFQGTLRHFYAMPWNDYYIWGATAGMLVNFYNFMVRDV